MKRWIPLTLLATALTLRAHAAPQTWNVVAPPDNPGFEVAGSVSFDPDVFEYSDIDLVNGTGFFAIRYVSNVSLYTNFGEAGFVDVTGSDLDGAFLLIFNYSEPLSNSAGVVDLVPISGSARCIDSECDEYLSYFPLPPGATLVRSLDWQLEGVQTSIGRSLRGGYQFHAPDLRSTHIDITLTGDGSITRFTELHPGIEPSATSAVVLTDAPADLTGQTVLFLELNAAMPEGGGTVALNGDSISGTRLATCADAQCMSVIEFNETIAEPGRVTTFIDPPTVISSLTPSVRENQIVATDVDAVDDNDSEGDGLFFTIQGGADSALFQINMQTGLVEFLSPPSFSAPADANADNVYELWVGVSDRGDRMTVVELAIRVTGTPEIVPNPTAVSFGDVAPYGSPVTQVIQIANQGTGDLLIDSWSITGLDDIAFELVDTSDCAAPVAPETQCEVTLRYLASLGLPSGPLSASVSVASNDPNTPTAVLDVQANVIVGTIGVPTSLDMGPVPVGATATRSLDVLVDGPVLIEQIVLDSPDGLFSFSSTCALGEVITDSCTVNVSYMPVALGPQQAILLLESANPAEPISEIVVSAEGVDDIDSDGDGVMDTQDNCTLVSNPDQRDTDGDGFGNLCDPDLNNDGVVNFLDLGLLRSVFFSSNADADFNGDGVVNFPDLGVLRLYFFSPPGPAGGLS
jgi:hypothetical protein